MTMREAANRVIEEQIREQDAWIEHTGDVTDPGELGMLVAAVQAVADGDLDAAADIFVALAVELADVGIREAQLLDADA